MEHRPGGGGEPAVAGLVGDLVAPHCAALAGPSGTSLTGQFLRSETKWDQTQSGIADSKVDETQKDNQLANFAVKKQNPACIHVERLFNGTFEITQGARVPFASSTGKRLYLDFGVSGWECFVIGLSAQLSLQYKFKRRLSSTRPTPGGHLCVQRSPSPTRPCWEGARAASLQLPSGCRQPWPPL